MADTLIIRSPGALSAPGLAPRVIPALPVDGAVRRYVARSILQDGGTAVASWPDLLGGPALTQSTVGARPTFDLDDDGGPSVILDGTDDWMEAAYTSGAVATTMILWARMRSLPASGAFFFYAAMRATTGLNSLSLFSTTGRLQSQGQNSVGSTGTVVTVETADYHMVATILKGTGSTVINDTTVYAGADSGTLATAQTLRVGNGGASSGTTSPLSVKEVIVYQSALTTGQVEQIRAFLAEQYA